MVLLRTLQTMNGHDPYFTDEERGSGRCSHLLEVEELACRVMARVQICNANVQALHQRAAKAGRVNAKPREGPFSYSCFDQINLGQKGSLR